MTTPDSLREALEAIDLGIYPASSPAGPRTPWQDGWNAGVTAMEEAVRAALAAQPTPPLDVDDEWYVMDAERRRLRRIEVAAREELRTRDAARDIAGRHVEAGHQYTDHMPDLEAATVVAGAAEEALRAALSEPNRCPFCAEGLPLDATGWHIREPGPDDLEGIQRIPCAKP